MSGIPAGAGSLLGKRLGKYEILALLALGGTAEIYLARIGGTAGFEKYVVVKCLHDHLADDLEFVKMFLDEARLAAYLDHSNIVQTMELGEHQGRYYMVMEFLAGLSMAMMVRRAGERLPGGRIPVPLVLNMMAQACAGLHYAHERATSGKPLNIVHRDISPQNLVISFEGVVKVVDFGIAKAEMRETRTRSGTIKGKFAYMSPEQCVANNVDRRTDVFALGVIAHEMLTGRRLFKRPSPYETYQSVIECNVASPSSQNVEIDPALDPIVMKALAKDKEQRYASAEAFGDALQGYLHHRGKGSGPNEIGRFFEASFLQEIEEHGARMRELINGRDPSVDTGVGWGGDEEEAAAAAASKRREETVDLGRHKSNTETGEESMSLETADLEMVTGVGAAAGRPGSAGANAGSSDAFGEDSMPSDRTRIESNPLEHDLPPLRPSIPPSGALPLPPAPIVAHAGPRGPAKRFPDLANLPTKVAHDNEPSGVELAPTDVAAEPIDPLRRTALAAAVELGPSGASETRELRGPIIHNRGGMGPAGAPQPQPRPQQPIGRTTGPQPQPASPYPVVQSSQIDPATNRPFSHQVDSGQFITDPRDPQRAASTLSPVGDQYPQQVDWEAAAAMPARALPTWMLAILFVGAIGIALTVTIVFARILR